MSFVYSNEKVILFEKLLMTKLLLIVFFPTCAKCLSLSEQIDLRNCSTNALFGMVTGNNQKFIDLKSNEHNYVAMEHHLITLFIVKSHTMSEILAH